MFHGKLGWMVLAALIVMPAAGSALAAEGIIVDEAELTVVRQGVNESIAMPGTSYSDFTITDDWARFLLQGVSLEAGARRIVGNGITRVSWGPAALEGQAAETGESTLVEIEFARAPISSLINAVAGTEHRSTTPQVIAGFIFDAAGERSHRHPVVGSYKPGGTRKDAEPYGGYALPKLPKARYSDALVNLKVTNADFRDVLWLMSQIGNVSIMLDPYWDDEPTGSRRAPGGGAGGGGGGDGGGAGFRPGGGFVPVAPREGTGNLSLNFNDVPFDLALDLVLMSVGLVKVDVWPGTFD
ncbi:hypothetical protein IIA79_07710 [bacterium]|nr:hypothetical protein [bacterium]